MPPKPKTKKYVKDNAVKPDKEQDKAKTPVYNRQEVRKLQEKKNKPKTKGSMGYSGATRV